VSVPALNLARSAAIVWRHKIVAASLVTLCLAGTIGYTLAQPEVYTSSAFVMLPVNANDANQAVIATSVPVLADALRTAHLGLSLDTLRKRVQAAPQNAPKISITAEGPTARQAERTANAVTRSYLRYVGSARNPEGPQAAELLQLALTTTAKPRTVRVSQAAAVGLLAGVLLALIVILAGWRGDRRLRTRNDVADSIGVPVLASLRASTPNDTAGWTRLLEDREQGAADTWQLERVLRGLGVDHESGPGSRRCVAVLSVSGDRDALALGPRLAAFAAAHGVPAVLSVGRLTETKAGTALRAACGPDAGSSSQAPADGQAPAQAMTVVVDADAEAPRSGLAPAEVAVLAATAGVVTAEQLARVVASAARSGLRLAGTVIINPYPEDQTTGLLPQLARSGEQGMLHRKTFAVTGRGR
jgi:capsular polysaccharide biosynthesis protein